MGISLENSPERWTFPFEEARMREEINLYLAIVFIILKSNFSD